LISLKKIISLKIRDLRQKKKKQRFDPPPSNLSHVLHRLAVGNKKSSVQKSEAVVNQESSVQKFEAVVNQKSSVQKSNAIVNLKS